MRQGSETPRVWTPPLRDLTPETSLGFRCIAFAELLGVTLLPWQQWLCIHLLELLPDYVDYYMAESDECWLPYKARRAYFDFLDMESATAVMRRFDGYTFIDGNGTCSIIPSICIRSAGDESTAVAEWSPSQRGTAKRASKAKTADPKYCATIESDVVYTEFVKATEAADLAATSATKPVDVNVLIAAVEKQRLQQEGMCNQ